MAHGPGNPTGKGYLPMINVPMTYLRRWLNIPSQHPHLSLNWSKNIQMLDAPLFAGYLYSWVGWHFTSTG
jgi:hypothetical protein